MQLLRTIAQLAVLTAAMNVLPTVSAAKILTSSSAARPRLLPSPPRALVWSTLAARPGVDHVGGGEQRLQQRRGQRRRHVHEEECVGNDSTDGGKHGGSSSVSGKLSEGDFGDSAMPVAASASALASNTAASAYAGAPTPTPAVPLSGNGFDAHFPTQQ